jgi:PIN domain nuclease of toxin-antitoxin system
MIVLDTHVLLWFLLDSPNLPAAFRDQLDRHPENVLVPSICTWEALLLAENGRIYFGGGGAQQILKASLELAGFKEAPLTAEIAALSRTLVFQHADPADRFIAATAKAMNAELATSDRRLRALPWVRLAY